MHFSVRKIIIFGKKNKENFVNLFKSPIIIALISCLLTVILAPLIKNYALGIFIERYVPKIDVSNDILTLFRNYTEAETRVISHASMSSPTIEAEKKILDQATLSLTKKVGEIYGENQQIELISLMREFNSSQVDYINAIRNRDKKEIGKSVSTMSKFPNNLSLYISKLPVKKTIEITEIEVVLRNYTGGIKTIIDSYQTKNTKDILSAHEKVMNNSDTVVRYVGTFFTR